jgi:hypothetical protein
MENPLIELWEIPSFVALGIDHHPQHLSLGIVVRLVPFVGMPPSFVAAVEIGPV